VITVPCLDLCFTNY